MTGSPLPTVDVEEQGKSSVGDASDEARAATLRAQPATPSSAKLASTIAWNEEVEFILGRPCFMFIREAQLYRSLGYNIPKKAEAEQAFFIHRWLNFYLEHGDAWRDVAADDMRDHIARAKARGQ